MQVIISQKSWFRVWCYPGCCRFLLNKGHRLISIQPCPVKKLNKGKNHDNANRIGSIGSFNWDARSAYINTELGVIIKSPEIAGAIMDRSEERLRETAYRVVLTEQGDLAWIEETDDGPVVYTKEPQTTWSKRFKVGFMRILPVNSQL